MSFTYLERREPNRNIHRFYATYITLTLFGEWALVRRWGRIGSRGATLENWFDTEQDARLAEEVIVSSKERRGYAARS